MRVCLVAPLSVAAVNGGVRRQAFKTGEELEKLGIDVYYLNPWKPVEDEEFDLAHVFLASPETLGIAERLHQLNINMLVSPVFFSTRSASFIKKSQRVEELVDPFFAGIRTDFSIKGEICRLADWVAPNTQAEAELLIEGLGVDESVINVIPNAVESRFADATPELFISEYGIKDFVLFAGHAGAPRKGLNYLLETASNIDQQIVIIGSFYDDEFGRYCQKLISRNDKILHMGTLPHNSELLASAYAACKTFVLPSFYETPGIAALEAALAGANIAITSEGGTREYFGEHADYLKPKSAKSVAKAVNNSLERESNDELKQHILENYTWERVTPKLAALYEQITG